MPYFETTVMVQRLSVPDLSSFTEQTISVTVDAMSVNVAFWPPVSGIAGASRLDWIGRFHCLHAVTEVAVRETIPRRTHGISETLIKDSR
jgi:hypothetical protein